MVLLILALLVVLMQLMQLRLLELGLGLVGQCQLPAGSLCLSEVSGQPGPMDWSQMSLPVVELLVQAELKAAPMEIGQAAVVVVTRLGWCTLVGAPTLSTLEFHYLQSRICIS